MSVLNTNSFDHCSRNLQVLKKSLMDMGFDICESEEHDNSRLVFLSTQTRYVLRQICTTPLPARDKDVMKTWAQDIQMMHEILFAQFPDVQPTLKSCSEHIESMGNQIQAYKHSLIC